MFMTLKGNTFVNFGQGMPPPWIPYMLLVGAIAMSARAGMREQAGAISIHILLTVWVISAIRKKAAIGKILMRITSARMEKGKTMKPYEIVMLVILAALEIPAAIILAVGWVKACKEAREREDNGKVSR